MVLVARRSSHSRPYESILHLLLPLGSCSFGTECDRAADRIVLARTQWCAERPNSHPFKINRYTKNPLLKRKHQTNQFGSGISLSGEYISFMELSILSRYSRLGIRELCGLETAPIWMEIYFYYRNFIESSFPKYLACSWSLMKVFLRIGFRQLFRRSFDTDLTVTWSPVEIQCNFSILLLFIKEN